MSANEDDKYPSQSGRRRFVKGVVGGAALAGVGATGSAAINSATTSPGAGGGATEAMAIENTAGPAPRGMPQIPVEITPEGFLKGVWPEVKEETQQGVTVKVAQTELGGKTYSSEWYQFCGVESYEGIQPAFESDNIFRSDSSPAYAWQQDALEGGEKLASSMFDDYEEWGNGIGMAGLGKPATGSWRSQGTENTIPIQVIRSPIIEDLVNTGSAKSPTGETYEVTDAQQTWLKASTQDGFIAWLNKCTHFCCVPGWKQTASSAKFNAANEVYCPCHQSVYEPFSIVSTLFTARPRPPEE